MKFNVQWQLLERDRFRLNQPWFDLKRESPYKVRLEHDFEVEGEAQSDSTATGHALEQYGLKSNRVAIGCTMKLLAKTRVERGE